MTTSIARIGIWLGLLLGFLLTFFHAIARFFAYSNLVGQYGWDILLWRLRPSLDGILEDWSGLGPLLFSIALLLRQIQRKRIGLVSGLTIFTFLIWVVILSFEIPIYILETADGAGGIGLLPLYLIAGTLFFISVFTALLECFSVFKTLSRRRKSNSTKVQTTSI